MPIIMTGSLDRFGGARNDDGKYASNSNGVGYSGNVDRRLYFAPSTGPLYAAALADLVTLRLHMMVRKVNDDYPESHITAYFYNKKIDEDTGEEGWNYNKVTDLTYTYPANPLNQPLAIPIPPGDKSQEVEVEIPEKYVENALLYGIGLAGGTRTNASTGEEYPLDAVSVTDCYLEADVMSVEAPPGVEFDSSVMAGGYLSEEGTYIHDATKRLLLGFSTSHEKGTAVTSVDTVVLLGTAAESEEGDGEAETVIPEEDIVRHAAISPLTIAPERGWGSLPAAGRLGIRARTVYAESEWIWLPFRVAHTDLLVTSHTSGMILPDNEGIALVWEHLLPEGLSIAPAPDIVEIHWNRSGDALWSGASVSGEDLYTIPEEELSGGTVFEVRIGAVWLGAGGEVRLRDENRVVLYFFVQSVAEASALTVGEPWDTVRGYYPPLVTLSWESVGQTAYQIMIDGKTEKVVWGNAVSHAVEKVLEDGMHTAAIRVQDANGIWTDWGDPVYFRVLNETEEDTVYGAPSVSVAVMDDKAIVGIVPSEGYVEPDYENLAKPSEEEWAIGYCFDGNDPLLDPVDGGETTNYITVAKDETLYIAGFDFSAGYRIACYKGIDNYWGGVNYYGIEASTTFSPHLDAPGGEGTVENPYVLGILSSTIKYIRISGLRRSDVDHVIVSKTPIRDKEISAPVFDGCVLYRNGVPIASLPSGSPLEYNDVYANGTAEYFVRSIRGDGRYAQSLTVSADLTASYDRLDFPDGVSVRLKTMVSFPRTYLFSETEEATSVWYRGRTFPVTVRSGRKTRSITLQYREKGTRAADLLSGRSGDTAYFRDVKGGRRMVVITNLSIGRSLRWCDISITMTETDFTEEVEYER